MKQVEGQLTIWDCSQKIPVEIKGLMDDGYCPNCGVCLEDMVPKCPYCGTLLDWDRWKDINWKYINDLM